MDTSRLKKFAQYARRSLIEQVESKLNLVLAEESQARRESPAVVAEIEKKLKLQDKDAKAREKLVEQVAYIWFNRFCALRFMDVNQYNRIMVLSPLPGQFQPEILAEAKAGHIDESICNQAAREQIFGLLGGSIASRDSQSEAFRLLIVAVCNDLHRIMPYLFERIEDYSELLMPDDLLSGNSILAYTREAMTPEACESVESIGWLYQFYISEKKDQVFEGLKKNKKITPENIPAATQLFTPHWIVRYLVENSLGRLWMQNNPDSKVIEQMDYYIKPIEAEMDFLRISSPEDIKVCDPACGSGHMLTYAYDLLYAIYSSTGEYDESEIPGLILTKNLYGIEIDDRAAELAAFALTMKAVKGKPIAEGTNRRRFFRNPVKPNICRLEKVVFSDDELDSYIDFAGRELLRSHCSEKELRATFKEFEAADNFGSLIQPTLKNPADVLLALEAKEISSELFLADIHKSALKVLQQAEYLNSKYHVVIANPPYMAAKGMNKELVEFTKKTYPTSKADLFSIFMDVAIRLGISQAYISMINMQSWMFLPSFKKLRENVLNETGIVSMAHIGTRGFDSIGGEVVSTTAFVLEKSRHQGKKGQFFNLTDGRNEAEKSDILLIAKDELNSSVSYKADAHLFANIPGMPISYWVPEWVSSVFERKNGSLYDVTYSDGQTKTGDNDRFLRYCWEPNTNKVGTDNKWWPHPKGGAYRKWFGNVEHLIDWSEKARTHYRKDFVARILPESLWKRSGVSWTNIAGDRFSFRHYQGGWIFNLKAPTLFFDDSDSEIYFLAFLNSKISQSILKIINPTMSLNVNDVRSVPFINLVDKKPVLDGVGKLIKLTEADWNSTETSLWFTRFPMLLPEYNCSSLEKSYGKLRSSWQSVTDEVKQLEEKNNQIFLSSYDVNSQLSFDVPLTEVTLNCNPKYRYGGESTEIELEGKLLSDTIREFLSYSVGCMFGRYSFEKEGLILANQGDTLEEYLKQIPTPSFMPDKDNVIPLIDFDGDWFEDDISERFKVFLKVTFGEKHFPENLMYIEESIGKSINKYFVKDFYADHVKRYKKRPIYWMFSSPKGSFNALIYMHRYRPDTVSVVLNDYLREFRTKLQARKESYEQIEISASASQSEKTKAIKAIQKVNKVLGEINEYEHDTLYPLAGQSPEIDLDDGVKHNYPLFGKALKKVTGLS